MNILKRFCFVFVSRLFCKTWISMSSVFKTSSFYLVYDIFLQKVGQKTKYFLFWSSFIDIYTSHNSPTTTCFPWYSSHSFLNQRNPRDDKKGLEVSGIAGLPGGARGISKTLEGQDHLTGGHGTGRQRGHWSWRKTFYQSQLTIVIWTLWGRGGRGSQGNNEANLSTISTNHRWLLTISTNHRW